MNPVVEGFVNAARSYVGTPFHWHGRVPGVGLDCSGVIVCAGRQVGLEFPSPRKYTKADQCQVIYECLSAHCRKIDLSKTKLASGDILVFEIEGGPGHIMVVDGETVIHATDEPCFKAVVQQALTSEMLDRVSACYRLKVTK